MPISFSDVQNGLLTILDILPILMQLLIKGNQLTLSEEQIILNGDFVIIKIQSLKRFKKENISFFF